jgi:hypothetical protein
MSEDIDNLIIDETNFSKYFREAKDSRPQEEEVLVVYRAVADLGAGDIKKDIIDLLCLEKEVGAKQSIQVAVKLARATEETARKMITEICEDLFAGRDRNFVMAKSYEYLLEIPYYTKLEYIPENDKHWEIVNITNLESYIKKVNKNTNNDDEETNKETDNRIS